VLLKDTMVLQGQTLFRFRSYLPLALVPIALLALFHSGAIEQQFGSAIEQIWEVACLVIAMCGLLLRAAVIGWAPSGTSGRSTKRQRADTLNTDGLYSAVRNPLYLGNFLMFLGLALAVKVWWLVPIAILAFTLYYERIILAEEDFLEERFDASYRAWASRTPAFLPNPGLWRWPDVPFSFHTVLRREYHGLYVVVTGFTLIEFGHDVLGEDDTVFSWIHGEPAWASFFLSGTVVYAILRFTAKKTRMLHIPGR
jgi:protein-S-isoprenylcysteine O-methyltransferase Ste14